ncbi:uncharacterized protein LOC114755861 [Neltuma alba]|uniref:uncharacterized protein LOC114755861 n=1 Tax=Neltuma alba TaxID=207710 RepID=UPI0010A3FACB|nr:uncharacterized protein LOC114755861 [Prosopis alba]
MSLTETIRLVFSLSCLHGLGIGVTSSDTSLESWFSSDRSTGYLEDVIAGWSFWYKQQNLPLYSLSQDQKETHCLADQIDIFPPCSSTRTQRLVDDYTIPDNEKFSTGSQSSSPQDTHAASTQEDNPEKRKASIQSDENDTSVSTSFEVQWFILQFGFDVLWIPEGQKKRIAYPFEMVKRGGANGETVLEDINQQMRMSPAKPIPHPVRDRVRVPCDSDRGFGISGKAVVALTRIHTQGTGSITVVRTEG